VLAGQGVRHHIVHAGNMPDVAGELCHIAQMPALPDCPQLPCLGQGVFERLLVGIQCELPPLKYEVEVADPLSQSLYIEEHTLRATKVLRQIWKSTLH